MIVTALLFAVATRVEYARTDPVVVYALEENQRTTDDYPHQVFVAIMKNGREVTRRDVTSDLMKIEDNLFARMTARINRAGDLFDVVIETVIRGSGGISETEDFFYRVEGNRLLRVRTLKGTASASRGGVSYTQQTTSELRVDHGRIIWTRRERTAQAKRAGDPLRVRCRVSRKTYPIASDFRGVLPRIPRLEIVPCCAGCELRD